MLPVCYMVNGNRMGGVLQPTFARLIAGAEKRDGVIAVIESNIKIAQSGMPLDEFFNILVLEC
jgi:hypothetical protein